MENAVEVSNLSKTFHSKGQTVHALKGVDFTIKKGEIFGLLGPNGAGKTTCISILCGILAGDGGSVKILGLDAAKEIEKIKQQINVGSGFTGVLFSLSTEEALMYYALLYSIPEPKKRIEEVIRATNLEKVRKQGAEDLSSGMKQRFMIAKALLNNPKLLILDEPSVGLDVEAAVGIRALIKQLKSEGRTVLLTTHNMFEAEELCDRIAFINNGKIIEIGTPHELKEKIVKNRAIEINCSEAETVSKALSKVKGTKITIKSSKIVFVEVKNYLVMKDIFKVLSTIKSEIFNVSALEPNFEETYLKIIGGEENE